MLYCCKSEDQDQKSPPCLPGSSLTTETQPSSWRTPAPMGRRFFLGSAPWRNRRKASTLPKPHNFCTSHPMSAFPDESRRLGRRNPSFDQVLRRLSLPRPCCPPPLFLLFGYVRNAPTAIPTAFFSLGETRLGWAEQQLGSPQNLFICVFCKHWALLSDVFEAVWRRSRKHLLPFQTHRGL